MTQLSLKRTAALGVVIGVLLLGAPAHAAPVLVCGMTGEAQVFPGATTPFEVTLSNATGTQSGFLPAVELTLKNELTLQTASFLGQTIALPSATPARVVNNGSTSLVVPHPVLSGSTITVPAGSTYFYVPVPISALPPAAGSIAVRFSAQLSGTAPVGTAIADAVQSTCAFELGTDAVNQPVSDPPIFAAAPALIVTPVELIVKVVGESCPFPSGPSYTADRWTVQLFAPAGRTLTNVRVAETLGSRFFFTAVTDVVGTANTAGSTFSTPATFGVLDASYASLVGAGPATPAASFALRGYVPECEIPNATCIAGGTRILSATTPGQVAVTNGSLSTTVNGGPAVVNASPANTVVALAVDETIACIDSTGPACSGGFVPGNEANVSLRLTISDYFDGVGARGSFSSVSLQSALGRGLEYNPTDHPPTVAGGFAFTPRVGCAGGPGHECADGTTQFDFVRLGPTSLPVGASNPVILGVVADVRETFQSTGTQVLAGDVILTNHATSSTGSTAVVSYGAETCGENVPIRALVSQKSIFKYCRQSAATCVVPDGLPVLPGDTVIYRLQATFASGDTTALVLTDFVPAPFFDVMSEAAPPGSGLDVAAYSAARDDNSTVRFYAGPSYSVPLTTSGGDVAPTSIPIARDAVNNSYTITFAGTPSFSTTPSRAVVADVLFKVTARFAAAEDDLVFTNLLRPAAINTVASALTDALIPAPVTAGQPDLRLLKQAVALGGNPGAAATIRCADASNCNGNVFCAPPVNSACIASNGNNGKPTTTDSTDLGDTITYRLFVENNGNLAAFDATLKDVLPAGFAYVAGSLTCTQGCTSSTTGNLDGSAAQLFGAGLNLEGNLAGGAIPRGQSGSTQVTDGSNIIVLEYRVAANSFTPAQSSDAKASLTNFTSVNDGTSNFVTALDKSTYTSTTTQTSADFALSKQVISVTSANSAPVADNGHANPGDVVRFRATFTIPEGINASTTAMTITDTLPSAFVGTTAVIHSVACTNLGSAVVTSSSPPGQTLTFGFSFNNVDNDANVESCAAEYSVVVAAHSSVTRGATLTNAISLNDPTPSLTASASVVAREPNITVGAYTFSTPGPYAANQEVTVTARVTNNAGTNVSAAEDFSFLVNNLSAQLTLSQAPSCDRAVIAPGQFSDCTFKVTVGPNPPLGGTLTFDGHAQFSSQAGNPSTVERTYDVVRSGALTAVNLTFAKTTPAATYRVGEKFNYTIAIPVPIGTRALSLTDAMPPGLRIVDPVTVLLAGSVTCSASASCLPTQAPAAPTSDGQDVVFNFGTVTATVDSTITLTVPVQVVQNGAQPNTLTNSVSDGASSAESNSASVVVPTLALATNSTPTAGDAGDVVTVTTAIVAGGGTTAEDVSIVFDAATFGVGPGQKFVAANATTTCPGLVATVNTTTNSVTFVGSIASGVSCQVQFTGAPTNNAQFGEALSFTGGASWHSLAASDPNAAARADYAATGPSAGLTFGFAMSSAVDITKTRTSGSSALKIGDVVSYDLAVRLPEGTTPNVALVDDPPAGLRLTGVTLVADAGVTVPATGSWTIAPSFGATTSGQVVTMTIGTVVNSGNNTAKGFVVRVAAVVVADAAMGQAAAANTALPNLARLLVGAVERDSASLPIAFAVPEPRLSLASSNTTPRQGDVFNLTPTLTNNGDDSISNTTISVTIDPTKFTVNAASLPPGATVDVGTGVVTIAVTGPIAPGLSVGFPISVSAVANIGTTAVTIPATLGSYESSNGTTLSPATDGIDNNGSGGSDEANDNRVGVTLNPQFTQPVLTQTITTTAQPVDAGDVTTVTIAIANSAASGSGINASNVVLDYDFGAVSPTFSATSAVVTCDTGSAVTASIVNNQLVTAGAIELGDTCRVAITGTSSDTVVSGSSPSYSGSLSWQGPVGGQTFNDTSSFGLQIKNTATVQKVQNGSTSVRLGETVQYDLLVTLIEGTTPAVVVTDTPPAGLKITSVAVTAPGGATVPAVSAWTISPALASAASGQQVQFSIGTIVLPGDNDSSNNTVQIRVTGTGVYSDQIVGYGAAGASNATALFVNGAGTPNSTASAPVAFLLPQPVVSISTSNATPSQGGAVTFTPVLDNSAGTDAVCDTELRVVIPPAFAIESLPSGTGFTATQNGNVVTIALSGCVAAGATQPFTIATTATTGLAPDPVTATVTLSAPYSNASGAADENRIDALNDKIDTNADATVDGANDNRASVTVTPNAPRLQFVKTAAPTVVPAGAIVTYTIVLTNLGTGAATGIALTDVMPTINSTFVTGSASVSGGTGSAVSVTGNTLTVSATSLNAGVVDNTILISYQMRARDPQINTDGIDNQATVTTSDGYAQNLGSTPDINQTPRPTHVTVALSSANCASDSDCVAAAWCSLKTKLCLPDVASGSAPTDTLGLPGTSAAIGCGDEVDPANQSSTVAHGAGASQCISGICDARDGICGAPNGVLCAAATECRSAVCNADGRCGDPNGAVCTANATCRAGICDGGFCGRSNGQECKSEFECRSSVCVAADGRCGAINGEKCTLAGDCRSNVCDADQRCGKKNDATCTSGDECRSGSCQAGQCNDTCETDADCPTAKYCDGSKQCALDLANDRSCDRAAQCQSAICHSDNKCGLPNGQPSADAKECRSSVRDTNGVCGAPCANDAGCLPASFCDTDGACKPDRPNGDGCVRAAECAAGVCHADGKCGLVDGFFCMGPSNTPISGGQICRSGICNAATGNCGAGCVGDAECGDNRWCSSGTCVAPLSNASACERNTQCSSNICEGGRCGAANAVQCGDDLQCRSGLCNLVDTACGKINGETCDADTECRTFCSAIDGRCGATPGGPCASADVCRDSSCEADGHCGLPNGGSCAAPVECRGQTCVAGSCAGQCTADGDCPTERFCDSASRACRIDRDNRDSCDRAAQCNSGVCHSDGLCGLPVGESCTSATVCRDGSCVAGVCSASCSSDAECAADAYCNGTACVPDQANDASCDRAAQCASGTCFSDNKCGKPDGEVCASAAVCRGASCNADGLCGGGCTADSQCLAGFWCDGSTAAPGICVIDRPNRRGCERGAQCASDICLVADGLCGEPNGANCGVADQCRDGVCDPSDLKCGGINGSACASPFECRGEVCVSEDGRCGKVNGEPCASAAECRSAVCNADGRCGNPNGGACAGGDGCRSGACQTGLCTATCSQDSHCAAERFCDLATSTCVLDLANTTSCDRAAQCRAGVCHSDASCGLPDGTACTESRVCRSGSCSAGVCGATCRNDADCDVGAYCQAGSATCRADEANGTACDRDAMCRAGACGDDGMCGLADGEACASATRCRSEVCDAMGTCGTLCAADSECRADRWCNATNGVCEADRVNTTDDCERPAQCRSNVCNADKKCGESSGEQCGAAYQCRANVCFAEDTECGLPNSEACTSAAVCRSSLCFTDGLCGKPNGESCMALTECRSNKCVGMVCSGCATDAECSATQFCDTTEGDCAPKRPDGQACSSPNQCVSAMCSPEGTCGNPEKPLTLDDVSVSGGACNATGNGAVPWGSLFLVLFAMVSLRRRRAD